MTKNGEKNISNREVKNSAFTTFFGEPENASQLYAALGEVEVSPEDITYVTLEGVLFIARKNDLAFTVKTVCWSSVSTSPRSTRTCPCGILYTWAGHWRSCWMRKTCTGEN